MSPIWKLPVLYVCENNQYGEAMPVAEFVSVERIADRGAPYSMSAETVDGMNLEAVVDAAERAVASVRLGQSPYLLEMVTYRFRGHYTADPEHLYRSRAEVAEWRKRDPLPAARARLIELGADEAELDTLEKAVHQQLDDDQAWALEQPFLTAEQAADHVWIPLATHEER